MNLLFICESFPETAAVELTGGVETGDYYLAKEFAKKHQVTVITAARISASEYQKLHNITIIRCGQKVSLENRETAFARISFAIAAILKARTVETDLVQGSNVFTQTLAAVIGIYKRVPTVAWIADVYIGRWSKNAKGVTALIGELMERFVLKYPWSVVIAWSEAVKTKIIKQNSNLNVIVSHGGLDLDLYTYLKFKNKTPLKCICVSRLVPYKKVDIVITAFSKVVSQFPDSKLEIIGIGPELENLKRMVNKLGIKKNIHFLGFVQSHEQVLAHISSSQLLLHASEVEGFGFVVLESAACGVPYVHTNLNVTDEITKGGKGGVLVEIGSSNSMSDATLTLLQDKKLYSQKQKEGLSLANSYSWSNVAKQRETIFNQVLISKHGNN